MFIILKMKFYVKSIDGVMKVIEYTHEVRMIF